MFCLCPRSIWRSLKPDGIDSMCVLIDSLYLLCHKVDAAAKVLGDLVCYPVQLVRFERGNALYVS